VDDAEVDFEAALHDAFDVQGNKSLLNELLRVYGGDHSIAHTSDEQSYNSLSCHLFSFIYMFVSFLLRCE